ncbi:hypothetical protein ACHQM5_027379 [Ranunculus cassubicifolius]
MDWGFTHKIWEKWASNTIGSSSGESLKAAYLLNYDPTAPSRLLSTILEQRGLKLKPGELELKPPEFGPFIDYVKRNNLQGECFYLGSNQYMVTSIHENWFSARCVNTTKAAGEGAIVMQTASYLVVALYEGSIASASRAMVVVDQLVWQLSRRNL